MRQGRRALAAQAWLGVGLHAVISEVAALGSAARPCPSSAELQVACRGWQVRPLRQRRTSSTPDSMWWV